MLGLLPQRKQNLILIITARFMESHSMGARSSQAEEVGQGRKVINYLNIPQLKSALVKGFGLD